MGLRLGLGGRLLGRGLSLEVGFFRNGEVGWAGAERGVLGALCVRAIRGEWPTNIHGQASSGIVFSVWAGVFGFRE